MLSNNTVSVDTILFKPKNVICDTNVWYDLAGNKINKNNLFNHILIATPISMLELYEPHNLKKDFTKVKNAVNALFTNSAGVYLTNPFDYIIQKQYSEYKGKEQNCISLLNELKIFQTINDPTILDEIFIEEIKNPNNSFKQNIKNIIDTINPFLLDFKALAKEKLNKRNIDKKASVSSNQKLISQWISVYSQNKIILDIENYPWHEIDLFMRTLDNFFTLLTFSDRKLKENDLFDLLNMVYVTSDSYYLTSDETIKNLIQNDVKTRKYFIEI